MSVTAASLLARLEELKKWQEKQQLRLTQQQLSRTEYSNVSSNYDTIEGLSEYDSTVDLTNGNSKLAPGMFLNEKNADTNPINVSSPTNASVYRKDYTENAPVKHNENVLMKSKKPFLKRGTGLVRFKMNPGDQKRPFNKIIQKKSNLKKSANINICNEQTLNEQEAISDITPLKRPEVNIKAVWFKVQDDEQEVNGQSTCKDNSEDLAKKTILQINELAAQNNRIPQNTSPTKNDKSNHIQISPPKIIEIPQANQKFIEKIPSDQTLYEQQLERELLIFEALEEKAMNSSFCSTNSSVLQILSSTPSKIRNRSGAKRSLQDKYEKQFHVVDNVIEELDDHNNIPLNEVENGDPEKTISQDELDKINSLESSVTSEDFQEKREENLDFKDDVPWSDVNTYTRENSSLSSASSRCERSLQLESTLISEQDKIENNPANVNNKIEVDEARDILAKKLKELDDEIQNFRKENAKLQKTKFELEKNQREFKKEKQAFEKYVLEEKIKVEFYLEDEKKKLAKEKMIFDRYVKDVHNKTTRKEREQISSLKEEIANLKEAAKLKETRNATSQARLRNQLKSFEKENANLREELEKLRKQNAKLLTSQQLGKKSTDTKMLHEINKNLSKLTKDAKVSEKLKTVEDSLGKKKDLVSALEAGSPKSRTIEASEETQNFFYGQNKNDSGCNEQCESGTDNSDSYRNYDAFLKKGGGNSRRSPISVEHALDNEEGDTNHQDEYRVVASLEKDYEMMFGRNNTTLNEHNKTIDNNKTLNEEILSDGSKEIKFPNGNIKKVSADGNYIALKYYNGDIKETKLLEGTIRYYYAESNSWQTTTADGTEILEFPNGQIEKKLKDGTTEIKFANGILKVTKPDGSQIISYPDNTTVDINANGEKIISLPNGQKEVHTSEHMRREYPDGTVKILYPDGIQETRYSNGRIRIKDRDGNLVLDSHDNT